MELTTIQKIQIKMMTLVDYISDHERNEGTKRINKDEDNETNYDDDDNDLII